MASEELDEEDEMDDVGREDFEVIPQKNQGKERSQLRPQPLKIQPMAGRKSNYHTFQPSTQEKQKTAVHQQQQNGHRYFHDEEPDMVNLSNSDDSADDQEIDESNNY